MLDHLLRATTRHMQKVQKMFNIRTPIPLPQMRSDQATKPNTLSLLSKLSATNPNLTNSQVEQAESEFSSFLDGIPSFTPSQGQTHQTHPTQLPETQVPVTWGDAWAQSQHHEQEPSLLRVAGKTVAQQEADDGAEVLAMLSAPSGDQLEDAYLGEEEGNKDYDWGLTAEQLQRVLAITNELFPDPSRPHVSMPIDHPLNLSE